MLIHRGRIREIREKRTDQKENSVAVCNFSKILIKMASRNVRILNFKLKVVPAILLEKRNEAPCNITGTWSEAEFTLPPRDTGRLKHSDFLCDFYEK